MAKLDDIVLQNLAQRVCNPVRIRAMLAEMRRNLKAGRGSEGQTVRALTRELEDLEAGTQRLYEAVEKGVLPSDASLQERIRKLGARRQAILIEVANSRQRASMPLDHRRPGHINAFAQVLRQRLLVDKAFAKQYLRQLVTDIRLTDNTLRMTGSYAALAEAVAQTKMASVAGVPTFAPKWLPDQGSNLGPAD